MNREQINLIYFGRIADSKNIDVIIKAHTILLHQGLQTRLDLIGGYAEEYKKRLDDCIRETKVPLDSVIFHGAHSLDYIAERLKTAHYFVFPSTEKKEGHSNSLTEAMAFGVVPIVSKAGFNESICGDKRLVVSDFSPEGFAERIIDIEKNGDWDVLSRFVYSRVINRFTETQAIAELKEVLTCLHEEKE